VKPNTYYSFGTLPTSFTTSSVSGIIVRNDGTVRETYLLRLTTGPPYTIWNSSTIAENNQFVMYTIGRSSQPPFDSFGESEGNDILTLWNITSSGTNFCVDGETPIAVGREPYIVDQLASDWQTIPVVITAQEAE
ncbi:MAG: hypothetical protein QME68_05885, partial [Elusimicrobiota bacterium]|nr:hypothetical protein [Elusimicrobiota bacterium]